MGLNNLATCTNNIKENFFIINGKPIKSINQFYNKEKSKLQTILKKINKKEWSKKLSKLTLKRNNKINDYLHKSSKYIMNHLVSNKINTLIIGYNKEWKQDINIGKVNNQNFTQIPYTKFIEQLKYKCKLEGINIKINEESYTSKCSFIDNEEIKKHENYQGKRIKRGLFRTKNNFLINSDINGSLNIMKKVVGIDFNSYSIEDLSVNPKIITILK